VWGLRLDTPVTLFGFGASRFGLGLLTLKLQPLLQQVGLSRVRPSPIYRVSGMNDVVSQGSRMRLVMDWRPCDVNRMQNSTNAYDGGESRHGTLPASR
jgi:hypothetical protein